MKLIPLIIIVVASFSCQRLVRRARVPANIFYQDDRQSFDRSEFPQWGSLHQTKEREKPWGTGFLIQACHIATAYHVVKQTQMEMQGDEVVYFHHSLESEPIAARPVLWGRAWEASPDTLNGEDWVVLELEKCLEGIEPLPLLSLEKGAMSSLPLVQIGFPEDRTIENIHVDYRCNAGPEPLKNDTAFGHDCATRPGNSGSPLLTLFEGKAHVVGITVASRGYFEEIISGYSGWIANKGCPISALEVAFKEYTQKKGLQ